MLHVQAKTVTNTEKIDTKKRYPDEVGMVVGGGGAVVGGLGLVGGEVVVGMDIVVLAQVSSGTCSIADGPALKAVNGSTIESRQNLQKEGEPENETNINYEQHCTCRKASAWFPEAVCPSNENSVRFSEADTSG
jgi:hypothetical protein